MFLRCQFLPLVNTFDKVHLREQRCSVKRGYEVVQVGHKVAVWLGHMVEEVVVTTRRPISQSELGDHIQWGRPWA